jgi:phosphate transport system substrate-binding protein
MRKHRLLSVLSLSACLLSAPSFAAELNIVGTGDGIELLRALGTAFTADNAKVVVVVPPSIGSGGGIAAVGSDKEVLGRVARPLTETEKAQGLAYTPFVRLPSAFFVNPSAQINGLTAAQVTGIYAGTITNWQEVGGADVKIKVVRREEEDSTLNVLRASMPGWKSLKLTDKSKTATTTQDAIDTVKQVEGAIGFGPYTRTLEMGAVVLKIDNKHPTDKGYPSAVTVALIHKPSTATPEAKAFVAFVVDNKAKSMLTKLGGVPISE